MTQVATLAGCQCQFLRPAKLISLLIFFILIQTDLSGWNDSLHGFNRRAALVHARRADSENKAAAVLKASERQYIRNHYYTSAATTKEVDLSSKATGNCDNLDFENNSTSGWKVLGDHQLVSGGNDPFGGFPKVRPGGKYSLQLNNNNVLNKTNFKASATRFFNVTNDNTIMNLHFAMVILNFPHDSASAARFRISLIDTAKNEYLCPEFNCYYEMFKGAVGASNFSTSATPGVNTGDEAFEVTFANWQSISIDLSAYTGKVIGLQVSCDWCVFQVDWAYCYIDADCGTAALKQLPCNSSTIFGPPGFQTYQWTLPNGTKITNSSSSLPISTAGTYTLRCNHDKNCKELPFLFLYTLPVLPTPSLAVGNIRCSLTVTISVLNASPGSTVTWMWQDSMPSSGRSTVVHRYRLPGIHELEIIVKDKQGCIAKVPLTLTLSTGVDVTAKCTDAPGMLYGPDDRQGYEASSNYYYAPLIYTWRGDDFYHQGQQVAFSEEGLYVVEAQDPATGCIDTAMIRVTIPSFLPNIFTPNGDGANDLFRFRWKKGWTLSVVNRWGNLVHESTDLKGIFSWDGTHDGRACSDGVFMYVLRPTLYIPGETAVTGNVTLVR